MQHLQSWFAHPPGWLFPTLLWGCALGVPFVLGLFLGKTWGTALFVFAFVAAIVAMWNIEALNGLLLVVGYGGGAFIVGGVVGLWAGSSLRHWLQYR